jgi:dihydrofolate synthase / folylpolyglutamate synthase
MPTAPRQEPMSLVPPLNDPAGSAPSSAELASQFLLGRINYEHTSKIPYNKRHLKLDRMRELLTRLGSPDAGLPIVHVAGTKGKGSTSAMIAGILQSAGYDTGLFTSPHLESIQERFVVNGQPCPGDELLGLVDQLRPVVEEMDHEAAVRGTLGPTYFELATAIALMHFAHHRVDLAVLEVGLGGRLDSTNVCQSMVSVITSISLDHTRQLGSTVEAIAAEKAGIIKPGVPVFCGPLEPGPRRVIAEIAERHGCRMFEAGHDFYHTYTPPHEFDLHDQLGQVSVAGKVAGEQFSFGDVPLRLIGTHQADNAALAIATCVRLRSQGWLLSTEAMHQTFAHMLLPGRVELVQRRPAVVLDVAHNVAAAEALVETLITCFASQSRILVLAGTRDKDVRGMVRVLLPHFQQVFVTQYQENPRAMDTAELGHLVRQELAATGRSVGQVQEYPVAQEAWAAASSSATADQLICITGSFFIVADLRTLARTGC